MGTINWNLVREPGDNNRRTSVLYRFAKGEASVRELVRSRYTEEGYSEARKLRYIPVASGRARARKAVARMSWSV